MLDELKYQKRIKDMKEGEEGFLLIGALLKDEKGVEWLNTNAMVSKKYIVFSKHIKKLSGKSNDYEITSNDMMTENADISLRGTSEIFQYSSDILCIDDLPINTKELVYKVERPVSSDMPNKKILEPLYEIFLDSEILNTVLVKTSIPEIINGIQPVFNGIILYGKGGTGKTALQRALARVYKNAGAYSEELNVAQMSEKYIGSLSNNLDARIGEILTKCEKMDCPAFIFLDEATSLVMSSARHNESGVDYYQEAVDVLKKYISNYPNLIFSITTNLEPDAFDDTLIREGRLSPVCIPYPGEKQKIQMWKHFLGLFGISKDLSDEDYIKLARAIPDEQGAFINEFCKSYLALKKLEMEVKQTGSENFLDVLARGEYTSMEIVKESIHFESLLDDIVSAVEKKHADDEVVSEMGFIH